VAYNITELNTAVDLPRLFFQNSIHHYVIQNGGAAQMNGL